MNNIIDSIITQDNASQQLLFNRNNNSNKSNNFNKNSHNDEDEEEEEDLELKRQELQQERKKWDEIKSKLIEKSINHEQFYNDLEHSSDGFLTIANYFGKTIIIDNTNNNSSHNNDS